METVDYVDLDRFMGEWYVIAHIPAWLEKHAYDEIERPTSGATMGRFRPR